MHEIVKKYLLLFEKISNTVRRSSTYDTDVDIYRSEIHIIQLIGDHSGIYISRIAELIGITKGTVSQIVKRLETKQLVRKHADADNNTRRLLRLTDKGQTAYAAHKRLHRKQHAEMVAFLNALDGEQRAVIEQFIDHAQDMITDHI